MVNNNDRAFGLLSIAAKAGKVVSGGFMTEHALQDGSAELVIIAENASENTKKKFTNKSFFYKVPCIVAGDSKMLGARIGKEARTTVTITDAGLAKQIAQKLSDEGSV